MCYGSKCNYEAYMGECGIPGSLYPKISEELGFTTCFIGGAVCCPEEEEYFLELKKQGELEKLRAKIQDMIVRYYRNIGIEHWYLK